MDEAMKGLHAWWYEAIVQHLLVHLRGDYVRRVVESRQSMLKDGGSAEYVTITDPYLVMDLELALPRPAEVPPAWRPPLGFHAGAKVKLRTIVPTRPRNT